MRDETRTEGGFVVGSRDAGAGVLVAQPCPLRMDLPSRTKMDLAKAGTQVWPSSHLMYLLGEWKGGVYQTVGNSKRIAHLRAGIGMLGSGGKDDGGL